MKLLTTLAATWLLIVSVPGWAKLPEPDQIVNQMQQVADRQIAHFHEDMERENEWENRFNAWTYGALYIGMEKWAQMAPSDK